MPTNFSFSYLVSEIYSYLPFPSSARLLIRFLETPFPIPTVYILMCSFLENNLANLTISSSFHTCPSVNKIIFRGYPYSIFCIKACYRGCSISVPPKFASNYSTCFTAYSMLAEEETTLFSSNMELKWLPKLII